MAIAARVPEAQCWSRASHAPTEVELKSERTSIVTWADVTAQDKIVDLVTGAFPTHAILGEEGIAGPADGPCTWLVDPLDGTSNYAHGIPFACTSVAVRDARGRRRRGDLRAVPR